MKLRQLGQGLSVSEIGLGCMGMSEFYGPSDDEVSIGTMHVAVDNGVTFFDTADMYGRGHNEELIGRFIRERGRDAIVLASKFGIVRDDSGYGRGISNDPAYARKACEQSLMRLGTDVIDLYYVHRIEQGRPIEEVMAELADLVKEGKIRHIGLSEASADTLQRAHAVHPVSALQSEYSLWTRDPEDDVLDVCLKLGIGFVPYSPLGRGFLTSSLEPSQLDDSDFRLANPRFEGDNYSENMKIAETIKTFAQNMKCTPAQLALAWLLAQADWIVPIPGTRRQEYLLENAGAADVVLSQDDLNDLSVLLPAGSAVGDRYTAEGMKGVNV